MDDISYKIRIVNLEGGEETKLNCQFCWRDKEGGILSEVDGTADIERFICDDCVLLLNDFLIKGYKW